MSNDKLLDYMKHDSDEKFNKVDKRFDAVEARFDSIEEKLDRLFQFKWQIIGGSVVLSVVAGVFMKMIGL